MKNLLFFGTICIFIFSCEKTVPDPNPIPDPEPLNQTILDSICVLTMVFDSEGTAWLGTLSQGLVKHGLTETKIFNSTNSPLTSSPIWDITVDSKNNIWIGSNGLIKYDGEEFTVYNTTNSDIPEDVVWSVAVDSKDNIWLASNRSKLGGLAKFDGEKFDVFTPDNSPLPVNMIHAIAIDNEDNVWLGATESVMDTYLIKISGESWIIYDSVDFDQKIPWISDIQINSKNQVCGTIDKSSTSPDIFCFDGNNMETYKMGDPWVGFRSIMIDDSDNFWCAFGNGYAFFDGDEWTRTYAEVKDGYYQNAYFTIEQAPDGNIWIGKDKGVEIIEISY